MLIYLNYSKTYYTIILWQNVFKTVVARSFINTSAASTKICHKFIYVFSKRYKYAYIFQIFFQNSGHFYYCTKKRNLISLEVLLILELHQQNSATNLY